MESERVELHKSLVDDIIKGMEEVEKLDVSSPSRQRMLPCYQEALFLLTGRRDRQGQCHSHSLISHSDSPSAGSSSLKRKFKEGRSLKVMTVGQELDDGYEWRMYGQKNILGSKFPRSYYKCTTERGCPARKEVKRSSIDPTRCEVTYSGKHTCIAGGGASAQMREGEAEAKAKGQVHRKKVVVGDEKNTEMREAIAIGQVLRKKVVVGDEKNTGDGASVEYEEF